LSYGKGKKGENEVCKFLEESELIEAKRNLAERRSGEQGDLITSLPCEFEVKAKKQPSVWKALKEAKGHVEVNEEMDYAVAFLKRKNGRGKPADRVVAMSWEDFREIAQTLVAEGIW
jgi:hypothetical protein